jgi:hypothetical protein
MTSESSRARRNSGQTTQPCIWDWLKWQDVDLDAHLTRLLRNYHGVGRVPADSTDFPRTSPSPLVSRTRR